MVITVRAGTLRAAPFNQWISQKPAVAGLAGQLGSALTVFTRLGEIPCRQVRKTEHVMRKSQVNRIFLRRAGM